MAGAESLWALRSEYDEQISTETSDIQPNHYTTSINRAAKSSSDCS